MKKRIKLKKRMTSTIDRAALGDLECEAATHQLLEIPGLLEQVKHNQALPKNQFVD
jgi:hypothetical protein